MNRACPALCIVALSACASAPPATVASAEPGAAPAAVLDARFEQRLQQPLAELARSLVVPPGENIVVRELFRDADTSHHLVGVRDREPPHRHDKSALLAVVLRGHGRMMIEGQEQPVAQGSILYVPRGTAHAFINAGDEPGVAYVVFAPPFDPADRVPAGAPPD